MREPKCRSCGTKMKLEKGKKREIKAVAKSMVTMRIKQTYVCPKCGHKEESQTFVLK